jgi:site-specific DNA-methyltransferase (adenine-specific)
MIDINKIYQEDCMTTMSKMPNDFLDVVVTSPPYNMGNGRKNGRGKESLSYDSYSDDLPLEEYFEQTNKWIQELLRVTKYYIFWNIQEVKGNRGVVRNILNNFNKELKETFIWAKTNPPSSINDNGVSRGYEYIFCFSKDNPDKSTFKHCNFSNYNGDYVRNCIIKPVNNDKENKGHSFSFGDWLPKYFINYFSKEGDLIYDPFMGTGTTAKASILLNRNYVGSEISKEYCNIADKRLIKYKSQLRMF